MKELLARGEAVYSICPNLTSQYRSRRGRKKNDVVDASNVARALLANPQLPVLQSSDSQRELQELSRAQRRLSEQLKSNRGALKELTEDSPVRDILEQVIRILVVQLKELHRQLRRVVSRVMPRLLDLPGVGAIMAGTLLADVGDPRRFPNADHFASYCGAAPVERGSGQNSRMQINLGGNRRLNWALHVIATARLRVDGGHSKQFVERLTSKGKLNVPLYVCSRPTLRESYSGACANLMLRPLVSLDIHIPGSGSAKVGTTAARPNASCGFGVSILRAPRNSA